MFKRKQKVEEPVAAPTRRYTPGERVRVMATASGEYTIHVYDYDYVGQGEWTRLDITPGYITLEANAIEFAKDMIAKFEKAEGRLIETQVWP